MKYSQLGFTPLATKLCTAIALVTLAGCGGSDDKGNSSSSAALSSSVASSSSVESSSSSMESSSSSSVAALGWELVWSDEFDGTEIDAGKWSHEQNCTGGGNNELQCYTDRAENSFVADGKLTIVARKETFSGPAKGDDEPGYSAADKSATREYTSARLRSKNKGDWKYGRMEINAKMPQGQGIWPAIWMLPTEWKYGGWPMSGEIDIFEAVNSNTPGFANEVHGTLHYGRVWPNNVYTGDKYSPPTNIWEDFHIFAVEWEEGEIRWYVDDVHFATQTKNGWFNHYWSGSEEGYKIGEGDAPFNQLFHMILNVAVGGNWPGNPNAETSFPQQMEVDYVRIYQCAVDPETGKGCATHINPEVTPLPGVPKPTQKEFNLFKDGASSFEFTVDGDTITNSLIPAFYDNGSAGNVVSDPAFAQGEAVVWDLMFNAAPGNAFLTSSDMSEQTKVDKGFKFTSMTGNGEFKFDIYVDAIDEATSLLIKLDSGWPNVSYTELTNLKVGEWQSIAIPFSDLKPNNIEDGSANLDTIINPFVIEPSGGTAHIKLNNIRVSCIADCAINPVLKGVTAVLSETFDVFVDEVDPNWDFGIGEWQTGGDHIDTAVVDSDDPARGKVLDIHYKTADQNGVAFIQSTSTKNATAFAADGYLQFDLKVVDYGNNSSGIVVKVDCVNPCSSGDIPLGFVANGEWETITVPVSQMVTGGLDLSKINTPFVILPTWGEQNSVHLQLDNIRWIKP